MFQNTLLDFTSELLDANKSIKIKAIGSSMLPFYREGDEFTIEKLENKTITRGNLLVFKENDTLVIHRLHKKIKNDQLLCWGDFNRTPDPIINKVQIIAQVIKHERNGKEIPINGALHKIWCFIIIDIAPYSHYFMILIAKIYLKFKRNTQN